MIKYPKLRELVPHAGRLASMLIFSLEYWGFNRKYANEVSLALKGLRLSAVLSTGDPETRESREAVKQFVRASYAVAYPGKKLTEEEVRAASAGYMLVMAYPELLVTLESFRNLPDLEVRKATYILIDVLGELFDLQEKLSRVYFQHLIYGLNKCLLLLREKGTTKRNLKNVCATLFRVYQLTRAYKSLHGKKTMSEAEFYAKVLYMLNTVFG